jgi:YegS/Rv2252/BmrU family lipid kinase
MRPMTRALLIRNPVSRKKLSPEKLAAVISVARDAGWVIDDLATECAGHATELARAAAADGVDVVVVYGGDGTVNEAVNGLAGSRTALAVLRGGTANVWAKEIRQPKDAVAAMRAIVGGERRRIDLGRAGERYFLLMAGIGMDARIVEQASEKWKRRIGALAYIITGVRVALSTKTQPVMVVVDGHSREMPLYWLLAGNTRSYGGVVRITHRALVDDGLLDIALMRRGGAWRLLVDGVRVFLGRHERSSNVGYMTVHSLGIETSGLAVQVDGEPFGRTPMTLEAAPGVLDVIVPAGLASPLFTV